MSVCALRPSRSWSTSAAIFILTIVTNAETSQTSHEQHTCQFSERIIELDEGLTSNVGKSLPWWLTGIKHSCIGHFHENKTYSCQWCHLKFRHGALGWTLLYHKFTENLKHSSGHLFLKIIRIPILKILSEHLPWNIYHIFFWKKKEFIILYP